MSVGSSYMKEACVTYFVSDDTQNEPHCNGVSKKTGSSKGEDFLFAHKELTLLS